MYSCDGLLTYLLTYLVGWGRIQEAQLLLGDRATRKHTKDCWNARGNDNLGWNDLQMYFKVIKCGTNRKLVYDSLLVVYSNSCRITLSLCVRRHLLTYLLTRLVLEYKAGNISETVEGRANATINGLESRTLAFDCRQNVWPWMTPEQDSRSLIP